MMLPKMRMKAVSRLKFKDNLGKAKVKVKNRRLPGKG